jgi:nucleoid-associated protein YgaU
MTSDAKIGLLLGLVFIFIIAFIINGLPSFHEDGNNNELTTNMVGLQSNPPVIAAKERHVINLRESSGKKPQEAEPPSTTNQDIRFTTALPESSSVVKGTAAVKPVALTPAAAEKDENYKTKSNEAIPPKIYVVSEGDSLSFIAQKFYGPQEGNKIININRIFDANRKLLKSPDEIYVGQKLIIPPLLPSMTDKSKIANVFSADESRSTESNEAIHPKIYVVNEGDSLAVIAQKFYGPQEGNKQINITRIFDANRKLLKSPDEIYVGQKLIIPPLLPSVTDKGKIANVFSTEEFEKVKSIGKRGLSTGGRKTKQSGWYVVREGDSLWQIAAEQLRDGSRYREIAKLNTGILDNEDDLSIGMRLRMPAQ